MRFGIFKLAYKVKKEAVDGEAVKYIHRLVYKDGLGNMLNVNGDEDDFDTIEVGEPHLWDTVVKQTQLPGG